MVCLTENNLLAIYNIFNYFEMNENELYYDNDEFRFKIKICNIKIFYNLLHIFSAYIFMLIFFVSFIWF